MYPNVVSPSTIWGAMQGAKNTLSEGFSWKARNGQKIRFWEDSWILDHPLIEDFEDMTYIKQCKQSYGINVGNYWINNSWVSLTNISQDLHNI